MENNNNNIEISNQQPYQHDINSLLYNNIICLTQIQYNNQFFLLEENNKLKKEKEILETKLLESSIVDTTKRKSCDLFEPNLVLKFPKTNHLKLYKKNKSSYSDTKINDIFKNMNNIQDIIDLKNKWDAIKHNHKLQKLYNLISPLEDLNKLVGLSDIKNEIFKIIIYFIENEHTDEYLHTIINGPPGVGKTEFAKIYSNIFVKLGILKSSSFTEIKKNDLVAKYLCQTSHKTKELLEKSMGGVLFLDEAYSLGNSDVKDSFAKEAIDMINQYLSERKNEFMFIVAGYEKDLEECFFAFNKGLKRRFAHTFTIIKYSASELMEIFKNKIKKCKYILDTELTNEKLTIFFKNNYLKFENSAGDIEKFINYIKYEHSARIFKINIKDNIIIINDLENSLIKFKNKESTIPFGFYI